MALGRVGPSQRSKWVDHVKGRAELVRVELVMVEVRVKLTQTRGQARLRPKVELGRFGLKVNPIQQGQPLSAQAKCKDDLCLGSRRIAPCRRSSKVSMCRSSSEACMGWRSSWPETKFELGRLGTKVKRPRPGQSSSWAILNPRLS